MTETKLIAIKTSTMASTTSTAIVVQLSFPLLCNKYLDKVTRNIVYLLSNMEARKIKTHEIILKAGYFMLPHILSETNSGDHLSCIS